MYEIFSATISAGFFCGRKLCRNFLQVILQDYLYYRDACRNFLHIQYNYCKSPFCRNFSIYILILLNHPVNHLNSYFTFATTDPLNPPFNKTLPPNLPTRLSRTFLPTMTPVYLLIATAPHTCDDLKVSTYIHVCIRIALILHAHASRGIH